MTGLQRAAAKLIKQHQGLRKAALASGIKAPYLSRLRNGIKTNPGPEILRKLGVKRRVSYGRIDGLQVPSP
jgi:hypothetical protein